MYASRSLKGSSKAKYNGGGAGYAVYKLESLTSLLRANDGNPQNTGLQCPAYTLIS